MNKIIHCRLDKLKPPDFDVRITPNPEKDDELRDSIKEFGVLLPLIVKETDSGLEIVAGSRRFRESGRAGLVAVPCIIVKTAGAAAEKIKFHENFKRLDLSHIDQAYSFAHMIKQYDMTETQISVLVGKSLAYVSQHLSLLQTDPNLIAAVHDGRINFSVARELVRCKDADERSRLMAFIEKNGATSEVVTKWVQESNRETAIVENETINYHATQQTSTPQTPLYPCAGCETPKPLLDMILVKLCRECHNVIFLEIEKEKMKIRQNQALKTSEPA